MLLPSLKAFAGFGCVSKKNLSSPNALRSVIPECSYRGSPQLHVSSPNALRSVISECSCRGSPQLHVSSPIALRSVIPDCSKICHPRMFLTGISCVFVFCYLLFEKYHPFCILKISGYQAIKIYSARMMRYIPIYFICSGRLLFVNQSSNFISKYIKNY